MSELRAGTTVRVVDTGEIMRLVAVEEHADPARLPDRRAKVRTVLVCPLIEGRERTCPVAAVRPACPHEKLAERDGGKYCTGCGSLIYRTGTS